MSSRSAKRQAEKKKQSAVKAVSLNNFFSLFFFLLSLPPMTNAATYEMPIKIPFFFQSTQGNDCYLNTN